jgi:oligopeptide/dipeptide ABC transporter ATP-binding protein
MQELAFEAEDIGVATAHGTEIVSGVDLAAAPGELVGLLGETGAGKSVTARAMLGLLPQGLRATGRIRFGDGQWIPLDQEEGIARHLGRTAGLMLQNPKGAFDPVKRIGPQLVEAVVRNKLMTKPEAERRAVQLCEYLGLGDVQAVFRLYPHELSGGMSQRAALVMTLMPNPKLLVVDEPTSALDANLRVEALRLLRSIARESDTAMVVISHDLGLVSNFCDVIAVLYAGHLVETGGTRDVLVAPRHPYTKSLIGCSLRISAGNRIILPTVAGEPPLPGQWPHGCYFHPRCPHAEELCQAERPVFAGDTVGGVACHFPLVEEKA